ncbi:MAG TPA: LysR substrate-binding domain-containing protein [Caulobacteraceae bacterium]|jgi:DNA-binding transcriptional LysR family regulator
MRDLNDLTFFAAVVTNGGISAASRALHMPKSRISRRVAALEAQLGVRLLERSTRHFKVTDVGQDVYRHAKAALSEADAIDEAVTRLRAEPQGLVKVSCPAGVDRVLAAALPEFLARYPKVRVQLIVSNRRIDLIEEGVDIAIRGKEALDADLEFPVRTIGLARAVLVASPDFVARHGAPATPADIPKFPTISNTDFMGRDRWSLVSSAGEAAEIVHEPRLSASTWPVIQRAVIEGMGVALFPELALREPREDGQLVRILDDWASPERRLHMVFTSRRGVLPSVRAFIDFAAEALNPDLPGWAAMI